MYKLVGADRVEYGPVTRETVLEWIAQGRANAQTIARFQEGAWKPLGTFDEFKPALGIPPNATPQNAEIAPPPLAGSAPPPPPFSGVGSQTKTNVAAILSVIFPIICCCCTLVGPALGLICGFVALSQMRANPNLYSTSPVLPKIGIALSVIMLILHILGFVFDAQLARYFEQFQPPGWRR